MNEEQHQLMLGILQRLAQVDLPAISCLQRGISRQIIQTRLQPLSLRIPLEVQWYFEWRNGLRLDCPKQYELFPQGKILSFEECLNHYQELLLLNVELSGDEVAVHPAGSFDVVWSAYWWPLFTCNGDEFWFVLCDHEEQITAPIYRAFLEDGTPYLVYDSLTMLLLSTVTAFETAAYYSTDEQICAYPARAAQIIDRYNPKRRQFLLNAAEAATGNDLFYSIQHLNPQIRANAERALTLLSGVEIVAVLKKLLTSPDAELRQLGVRLLGERLESDAVESLIFLLEDSEPEVRRQAIYALGQLGSERAVLPLLAKLGSSDRDEQLQVESALVNLREFYFVNLLVDLLDKGNTEQRIGAAEILGIIGITQSIDPLIKALQDPIADVRLFAADALGKLGNRKALQPLLLLLQDPDLTTREVAKDAIEKLKHR